jgi:hypothetical protein
MPLLQFALRESGRVASTDRSHGRSLFCQAEARCPPDAGAGSSHDRDFVLETSHALLTMIAEAIRAQCQAEALRNTPRSRRVL